MALTLDWMDLNASPPSWTTATNTISLAHDLTKGEIQGLLIASFFAKVITCKNILVASKKPLVAKIGANIQRGEVSYALRTNVYSNDITKAERYRVDPVSKMFISPIVDLSTTDINGISNWANALDKNTLVELMRI